MTNNKYAYVTLLFPNKYGKCTYLDGALLTGLGLRKHNVKYKLICMITKDISDDIIQILKIIYDDIVIVDYISPIKNLGIEIISEIFSKDDYINDNKYSEMAKIFTKLHIFNSNLFPYDKILFIDNDLIPLKNFDKLFNINCPAAWLEEAIENEYDYIKFWNVSKDIIHGKLIDMKFTKLDQIPGRSINAGLMLIKPDMSIYNDMIQLLQKPIKEWSKTHFKFNGIIDINKKLINYYKYPEQEFLTQYFHGKWHMIDGRFCAWGDNDKFDIWGMHMAGLKYIIDGIWKHYKTWELQIIYDDRFNVISNNIALWGFKNFPILKNILYSNLTFYINRCIIKMKHIKINDDNYNLLNKYQQELITYFSINN
jgi:hypothetical protein